VKAVECVEASRDFPGKGRWLVVLRQVATAKVTTLQAGFQQIPHLASEGGACPADNDALPAIALVDAAGRSIEPVGHRDECGHFTQQLHRDIIDLPWHTVGMVKVRQQVSQAALTAGCDQQYENENADNALDGSPRASSGGPVFDRAVSRLRVCIYRSQPVDRATRATVGDFVRGERLGPEQSRQLLAALTGAGPSGSCPPQGQFAVVHAAGNYLNVELGGCWRVARDEDNPADTGSANATALRSLLGVG
jgi:hypothetical protein